MLDDINYDLFGNPVYLSLDDCINQLKYDFDLVQISKTKLTSTVRQSLNDDFYRSEVICHELFPQLHSLEVNSFNELANSRFI